jgi:hypothetical protein
MTKHGLPGVLLALLCGCEQDPYEPNWLFHGEWIDIDGRDRSAEDACAGTFEYIDAYSGALAVEFGVTEHFGSYRWYSPEQYDADLPCGPGLPYPYACAVVEDHTLHTAFIPHEHEMVHLVHSRAGMCPSILTEGLAEYYGTSPQTPGDSDIERLAARLAAPAEKIANRDYAIAGRFAAYLVEQHGLESVLDVCRSTGQYPNADELSAAMTDVLGLSTQMVLDDFADEFANRPSTCNRADHYQSRVFACGAAAAAPDAGMIDGVLEKTYDFGCASSTTVGPFVDTIKIVERIDLDADTAYLVRLQAEDVDLTGVELTLAACEPCGRVLTMAGDFVDVVQFDPGRYSLELRAPSDFSGSVTVKVLETPPCTPLPGEPCDEETAGDGTDNAADE